MPREAVSGESGPIRCEKCGLPIERETAKDTEGYLWTGRCRVCRAGRRADFIGFVEENLRLTHTTRRDA